MYCNIFINLYNIIIQCYVPVGSSMRDIQVSVTVYLYTIINIVILLKKT